MSFLVAAYVITVGGVLTYGASVWLRRRAAARQRAAWIEPAVEPDQDGVGPDPDEPGVTS